jgi:hypothetical protein
MFDLTPEFSWTKATSESRSRPELYSSGSSEPAGNHLRAGVSWPYHPFSWQRTRVALDLEARAELAADTVGVGLGDDHLVSVEGIGELLVDGGDCALVG